MKSVYFPSVATQFVAMHLSEEPGQLLALDTRLELVPPSPLVENVTLEDALAQAQASPQAEVIEAEQTAAKAHAAAKLAYAPGVAVLGGWLHQEILADTVLPENFAYVGVLATFTVFDGLKREGAVKEAAAQEQAADLGVQLTKAKAGGQERVLRTRTLA